jgi:hypothetical protein
MSARPRAWEYRVFWLVESNSARPPLEEWPSQMGAHLVTLFSPGVVTLDNPKKRTDVYVNLGDPNYGLKLRGTENPCERILELKIRHGSTDGIEDWDKEVICENTSLRPQELTRDAIAVAIAGSEHRKAVVGLLDMATEPSVFVQVDLDKVRVQVDAGVVKMEAVEISVRRNGGGIWRSVCIEGADINTVRSFVDLPYFMALRRQGTQPIEAGPFEVGYPEFISSVLLSL